MRKIILALNVVVFQTRFFLQMTSLFISSMFLLLITVQFRTRNTRFSTRMDSFNEIKLIVLMYHMMLFTMAVPDPVVKFNIGYSACVCLVLGTMVNMLILIISPIKMTRRKCYIRFAK